jgi:FlgN protein
VSDAAPTVRDGGLSAGVLRHLDAQIASTQRLLEAVLRQGEAIRRRDVEAVLALVAQIREEMDGRGRLEAERTRLLAGAATLLGVQPAEVTLERMASLMPGDLAAAARERSATLRGLLTELEREHTVNRALMRQELAFLDHLVRLIGSEPEAGYGPAAGRTASATGAGAGLRALDLTA